MAGFLNKKNNKGFTLIELLVVMAILGILSSVAFGQYRNSQKKARDAQRKSDLDNTARALEMYYNDNKAYPLVSDGKIVVDGGEIDWTNSFQKNIDTQTIVYMKRLPRDPEGSFSYCYYAPIDGSSYALYAKLENDNDNDYCVLGYICNLEADKYYYVISSSNEDVECPE